MGDLGTEYTEISEVLYNHLPEAASRQINYCQPFIVYKMNAAMNQNKYGTANTFSKPTYPCITEIFCGIPVNFRPRGKEHYIMLYVIFSRGKNWLYSITT